MKLLARSTGDIAALVLGDFVVKVEGAIAVSQLDEVWEHNAGFSAWAGGMVVEKMSANILWCLGDLDQVGNG